MAKPLPNVMVRRDGAIHSSLRGESLFGQGEFGTHILFEPAPPKRKTKVWWVLNRYDQFHLGWVAWFPRWRKYGFYPKDGTVFEETCLREIAAFCERQTAAHIGRPSTATTPSSRRRRS